MTRKTLCVLALVLFCLVRYAAPTLAADSIRTVQLRLTPAPEPQYALQYLLEVPYDQQRPRNAALLYQTAVSQMMQTNSGKYGIDSDTLRQWRDSPLEHLSVEDVQAALARFRYTFQYLDAAAQCERCTWEYPVREDALQYVMPQLGEYRRLSWLLCVKARLEAHAGDFDAALKTLRNGISLGRDLGAGPSFVQHLVGVAIAATTAREIEGVIQEAEAPNLYWALTALPRPLVDPRASLQMESAAIYDLLPEMRTIEETVLTNEQVMVLWKRAAAMFGPTDDPGQWLDHVRDITNTMGRYPRAKAHLIRHGYAAETVESWPALYAILVYQHQEFRAVRDLAFKWGYVPYARAREGLREGELAMSRIWKYSNGGILANPLTGFMPALYRIRFLSTRLERDIAMLRCVEAIRMYAAEHEGELPGSLAEITKVPIPIDPVHGRAFGYQLRDGRAILESPVPPDGGPKDGLRYELTLR
jgi:hypothetical protein